MHALLHARIVEAAGWNLMLVIALPALVVWGASDIKRWLTGRPLITRRAPAWSIYLLFAAIMLFWILRNIPMAPFNFLAPHAL